MPVARAPPSQRPTTVARSCGLKGGDVGPPLSANCRVALSRWYRVRTPPGSEAIRYSLRNAAYCRASAILCLRCSSMLRNCGCISSSEPCSRGSRARILMMNQPCPGVSTGPTSEPTRDSRTILSRGSTREPASTKPRSPPWGNVPVTSNRSAIIAKSAPASTAARADRAASSSVVRMIWQWVTCCRSK